MELAILNMGLHAVATLVATAFIVAVIAAYLIRIAMILWKVIDRLVTILGAVNGVAEESRPMGAVLDDINRELTQGRERFEAAVARLEERQAPEPAEYGEYESPTWAHWGS